MPGKLYNNPTNTLAKQLLKLMAKDISFYKETIIWMVTHFTNTLF